MIKQLAGRSSPQLPTLVGGLLIGALVMGAVAPLIGSDRATTVDSGTPDFLAEGVENGGASSSGEPGSGDPSFDSGTGTASGSSSGSGSGSDSIGGGNGAGGTGATESEGGSETGSGSGGSVARTASDVGITKDTIRVGMMALNCRGCAAFGLNLEVTIPHRDIAQVYVDEINARGGIHGRKIELFHQDYDPAADRIAGGGTERRGCVALTERDEVFAMMMGGANENACFYIEHETPVVTHADFVAEDPSDFNRGGGRLWTLSASPTRQLVDFAIQIDRQRLLTKSTKWGVVFDEVNQKSVDTHFLARLREMGYVPAHVTALPQNPANASTKAAQDVPIMQAKGVTHVVMMANIVAGPAFVREATSNEWKPQYVTSDYPNGANDFSGGEFQKAGDWTGAIAVSGELEGSPEASRNHPVSKPCIDKVERALNRRAADNDLSWIRNICATTALFEKAMVRAGPNPTRRSFVQAMAATGEFPYETVGDRVTFGGRYGLGPVQWSGRTFAYRKVWRSPCPRPNDEDNACYVPEGPVYRMAA